MHISMGQTRMNRVNRLLGIFGQLEIASSRPMLPAGQRQREAIELSQRPGS
jgi:hypothetical protein